MQKKSYYSSENSRQHCLLKPTFRIKILRLWNFEFLAALSVMCLNLTEMRAFVLATSFIGKSHINRWADKEIPCCDFRTKGLENFLVSSNMGISKPKCSHHFGPLSHIPDIYPMTFFGLHVFAVELSFLASWWMGQFEIVFGWARDVVRRNRWWFYRIPSILQKFFRLSLDWLSLLSSICNNRSHWMHLRMREQHWYQAKKL